MVSKVKKHHLKQTEKLAIFKRKNIKSTIQEMEPLLISRLELFSKFNQQRVEKEINHRMSYVKKSSQGWRS